MNDHFKFRAWVQDEKQMLDDISTWTDDYTDMLNETIEYHQDHGVVLMQCTGLKDKNGKDIFEGDILLGRGVVVWVDDDYESEFVGWHIRDIEEDKYGKHRLISFYGSTLEPEIIGNCHENPELLKQQPQ